MKQSFYGQFMSIIFLMLVGTLPSIFAQKSANFQDCIEAFPICQMKTYHFGNMKGVGNISDQPKESKCFGSAFQETNSFWVKWKAETAGVLTFVINPNQTDDDFDFILYKREAADCNLLSEVRCMAAGNNIGDEEDEALNMRCKGRTGLSFSSVDEFESKGCKYASDNFLKMLHMEKDEEYLLLINNYDNGDGFSITFEGETDFRAYDECDILDISEPLMIVNLYPNPAVNSVNIEYLAQKPDLVVMDLLDITGKSYHHFEITPDLGKNKNTFLLNDMTKGSYLLRIKQGKFTTVRQFIKQ